MEAFSYINNIISLSLDQQACVGCGSCHTVCPHRLFELVDKKAVIRNRDACMECGACARNCPVGAISVTPGVGCAVEIIATWVNNFTGRKVMKGCC